MMPMACNRFLTPPTLILRAHRKTFPPVYRRKPTGIWTPLSPFAVEQMMGVSFIRPALYRCRMPQLLRGVRIAPTGRPESGI